MSPHWPFDALYVLALTRVHVLMRICCAGNAVSAAMVTHWICNVAVGQNFMTAVDSYGISAVYGFFALCSAVGVLYIRSNVPEVSQRYCCWLMCLS